MSQGNVGKSGQARLADFFFPIYERYFEERNEDLKKTVETKLSEAMRDESVEMFLSRSIGYGVILGLVFWALLTFLVWAIFMVIGVDVGVLIGIPIKSDAVLHLINALKVPALITITGVFGGVFGFSIGFASPILNLYLQSNSRKREINILMPDAISFMHALSLGGMNQIQVFEAVARAEGVYGEISQEFAIILQETRYFGVDYRTAIRERALNTPSDAFSQFLTDMLSILNSGGSLTDFLDEKRQKYMRTARQQQEQDLETMELFGEMYMTLSLFPLLLIILLVIMSLIGSSNDLFLFGIVYLLIPMTGFGFLVMISTVKTDDPGDGYLTPPDESLAGDDESALSRGVIDHFSSPYEVMDTINESEGTRRAAEILFKPHKFLANHPEYTLVITVPIVLILLVYSAVGGIVPVSWDGMKKFPIWSTFMYFYMPMYVTGLPYTLAYEVKARRRRAITKDLSDNLRKLSSANDTGQTLLESFQSVAQTSTGLLSREFEIIYNKVQYGISMKQALIEFNNKYQRPRLARMIKLIAKAQETSSQITEVLNTAADASEQADDMAREQKARSRMQVVIIIMTYLTLLVVMVILKTQFLDVMAKLTMGGGGGGGGGGGVGGFNGVNVPKLSLLFLHAVTMQGIAASMISGYLRTSKVQSGVKFMQVLPTIAIIAWMFV